VDLGLLVESTETVAFLARSLAAPVGVWIKIDVGSHRTGIAWDQLDAVVRVATEIDEAPRLALRGLLAHAGHAYHAQSTAEIRRVYRDTVQRMTQVRDGLLSKGFKDVEISVGDTPTCTLADNFSGVDEVRPGNFVFHDVMQLELGVCTEEEIAVAVACPVVAKHEERSEAVLYGGAIHLSKESIEGRAGAPIFGYVMLPEENGWGPVVQGAYVAALSQEHGMVRLPGDVLESIRVGDLLMVLPVHSCLTVSLLRAYRDLDGGTITAMGGA
jgi:D-serine deaminase-like pyridoxal phosphate-dependent protein